MRLLLWVSVLLATSVTTYYATIGVLKDPLQTLLLATEAVMIGEMILAQAYSELKEPTIEIKPTWKIGKMGFSVSVKAKNILDATILCNGARCPWEDKEGSLFGKKSLFVGDEPSLFFPFDIELRESREDYLHDGLQGVTLSVRQRKTGYGVNYTAPYEQAFYNGTFRIPRGQFTPMSVRARRPKGRPNFEAKVRIIGIGVEENPEQTVKVRFTPMFERNQRSDKIEDLMVWYDFRVIRKRVLWKV
jgi:hypothetical protein